jgi:hypothetical protein
VRASEWKSKHLNLNFGFSSVLTNAIVSFPSGKTCSQKFSVESDMKSKPFSRGRDLERTEGVESSRDFCKVCLLACFHIPDSLPKFKDEALPLYPCLSDPENHIFLQLRLVDKG